MLVRGDSRMVQKSVRIRILTILFSLTMAVATGPFPLAETAAAIPLGTLVTAGNATIGNIAAPTGTTIFTGDTVTSPQPSLINFSSGSRIEMTKASANFAREGKTLVVEASQGLLRFNFLAGEQVKFDAGAYKFTTVGNSGHAGELGMNRGGQVVMTVTEGTLVAVNNASGAKTEVSPSNPLVATVQSGEGTLLNGGHSVTDVAKSFQANELQGKCVVALNEAYPILGNDSNVIAVKGAWKLNSGVYGYKITACTKEAMIAAGASPESIAASAPATVASTASTGTTAGTVAGVVSSIGLGVGVHEATKSTSRR
jgi:hypothetical protein